GIKREFSVARTAQQNKVAKRKNRTLIEAARTMLTDSLLPTTFWSMIQFCRMKGIKREFSVARTLQQNNVAERKNRTLIEAVRIMLTDSLLPNRASYCMESN
ncbi:putative ribonuclease H-like domain-containing protein, partial [Tanacetum coccineum]